MAHNHPLYNRYNAARYRCKNSKSPAYKNYGGRGIEFKFTSFQEYLDSVGEQPGPDYTIDRIDNDGHYENGNLQWATRKEQEINKRERRDSLYWGVSRHSNGNWHCRSYTNGKRVHVGYSDSFGDTLALLIIHQETNRAIPEKWCSPVQA